LKAIFLCVLWLTTFQVWGEVFPPDDVSAIDKPNDNGSAIILLWKKMDYETAKIFYVTYIATSPSGPFLVQPIQSSIINFKTDLPQSFGFAEDNKNWHALEITDYLLAGGEKKDMIEQNKTYYLRIGVKEGKDGNVVMHPKTFGVTPHGNYFAFNKLNNFLLFIFLTVVIIVFINLAKKNPNLFVRRIAGLEAMDDALGRATEMGRPVLFVHGLKYMHEVPTIAAVNILGRIAKKVAEFDTGLKVANWDPVIQQVSRETVKESYIEAGRPDAYKEENIYFASSEQFSYAAAVEGLMVREKPAANFYFGYFYAESLLLSETGNAAGSIQIAGTDAFTQIPFFITTCDYTLIGEELYAASAYLSREPKLLGSLKGQDLGKLMIIIVLVLGTIFTTFGWEGFSKIFWPM